MDFDLETNSQLYRDLLNKDVHYLENEGIEIGGIKIWGSPAVPNFVGVFNYARGPEIHRFWDMIPADIQILVTHGPPANILDETSRGFKAGCADLKEVVDKLRPKYHIFGHIHEAYGTMQLGSTTYINASFVSRKAKPNPPVIFDMPVH
jgi:Icc-related predicted phosphoesterase